MQLFLLPPLPSYLTLPHPLPPLSTVSTHTSPPPTHIPSYIVGNVSLLPGNVSQSLRQLEAELKEGELTEKGYLLQRAVLLRPFPHLLTSNGTVQFARGTDHGQERRGGRDGPPSPVVEQGGHAPGNYDNNDNAESA